MSHLLECFHVLDGPDTLVYLLLEKLELIDNPWVYPPVDVVQVVKLVKPVKKRNCCHVTILFSIA